MDILYAFFITFTLVFFAELGDKTQLLVLSFSNKSRAFPILIGVAIGTFFSHGIAILFGSRLGSLNSNFQFYLSIFTYLTFILFGLFGFWKNRKEKSLHETESDKKFGLLNKISGFHLNYVFIIALSIVVGELGDKTFLASLGLGLQYPDFKFALVLGSIAGMVLSNLIAIFFGKLIGSKFSENSVENFSNLLFLLFGCIGILKFILG